MSNWINREAVVAILQRHQADVALADVEKLPSFPSPNPNWQTDLSRNVMGQTEDEFWDLVEMEDKARSKAAP